MHAFSIGNFGFHHLRGATAIRDSIGMLQRAAKFTTFPPFTRNHKFLIGACDASRGPVLHGGAL